jgi:hypothetical protein
MAAGSPQGAGWALKAARQQKTNRVKSVFFMEKTLDSIRELKQVGKIGKGLQDCCLYAPVFSNFLTITDCIDGFF